MLSKDVQKEIEFAVKQPVRVTEFKIDSTPHNVFFKHILDGNRWIEGFHDLNEGISQLKNRLFQEVSYLKNTQTLQGSQSYSSMPPGGNGSPSLGVIPKKYVSTAIVFSMVILIVVFQLILFLYSDTFKGNFEELYKLLF
jgi:hypothetical protein